MVDAALGAAPGRPWALAEQPRPGRAAEVAARASGGENCVMYRHSGAPAGELLGVKIAVSEEALVLSVTGLPR